MATSPKSAANTVDGVPVFLMYKLGSVPSEALALFRSDLNMFTAAIELLLSSTPCDVVHCILYMEWHDFL